MHRLLATSAVICALAAAGTAGAYDVTFSRPIGPGVSYSAIRQTEGPWEIRVVRMIRDEDLIHMQMACGRGRVNGVEPLSAMIARESKPDDYVIAAANADFFVMAGNRRAGTLCGMAVNDGELVMTARGRSGFVMTADGTPRIGTFDTRIKLQTPHGTLPHVGLNHDPSANIATVCTASWGWPAPEGGIIARMRGMPLRVNGKWAGTVTGRIAAGATHQLQPDEILIRADGDAAYIVSRLATGDQIEIEVATAGLDGPVEFAAGGGPELIRASESLQPHDAKAPRHPRTAIGYSEREVVLVTVDGRQQGWSVGMRLDELADLMARLGCTDAVNLDGGGSTTAWVRGKVTNRPSDGRERRIANALLVHSRAPVAGPLAHLFVHPTKVTALPGARIPMLVEGTDRWHNPVPIDLPDILTATPDPDLIVNAIYTDGVLQVGNQPGEGRIELRHPDVQTATRAIDLRIISQCAQLALVPPSKALVVGETAQFSLRGMDESGQSVWLPEDRIAWRVDGEGLEPTDRGVFKAAQPGARAQVRATINGQTAQAQVRTARDVLLESFEGAPKVRFTTHPETGSVTGRVETLSGEAPDGSRFARMTYDLGKPSGTRAAYLRLDREIGTALKLSLAVRGRSKHPPWLRAALTDGNGSRHTVTLASKLDPSEEFRRVEARLAEGLKPPLKWQSIYVVATSGNEGAGVVEIDDIRVARVQDEGDD